MHVTRRGLGLLSVGGAMAVAGIGAAHPVFASLGLAVVSIACVGLVWTAVARKAITVAYPRSRRIVTPSPLVALESGRIDVTIATAGSGPLVRILTSILAWSPRLREQAASELTGGYGTTASLATTRHSLTLTYTVQPRLRGRWLVGPALARVSDPLGIAWADVTMGQPQSVPVRPHTQALSNNGGGMIGESVRAVRGARTPSSDDSALRDYRSGDDPRRVHWPSSARKGTLVVRSDEHAGQRPATIIMNPPMQSELAEHVISAAGSIALAIIRSGHPVHVVGGGLQRIENHHSKELAPSVQSDLVLDRLIDAIRPLTPAQAREQLSDAVDQAVELASISELTIAITTGLAGDDLELLAGAARGTAALALVGGQGDAVKKTVDHLTKAGWHVCAWDVTNLDHAWLNVTMRAVRS